jgi:hypothetical protein
MGGQCKVEERGEEATSWWRREATPRPAHSRPVTRHLVSSTEKVRCRRTLVSHLETNITLWYYHYERRTCENRDPDEEVWKPVPRQETR